MTELPDQSDLAENSGPQEYDGPSKSQLKRDSQALQNMGKKLLRSQRDHSKKSRAGQLFFSFS